MRTAAIAFLTALAGGALGAVFGDSIARALRVSNFEGASGYAVAFLVIPAGIILGVIVAIVTARTMGAEVAWWKVQGVSLLVTAGIAGGIVGVLGLAAPKRPTLDGAPLDLLFELRYPEGRPAPDSSQGALSVGLVSNRNSKRFVGSIINWSGISESDGRAVVPGELELTVTTPTRSIAITDGSDSYWFDLSLPATPTAADREWSPWFPAPGEKASADPRGTNGFQVRWKVVATSH